MDAETVLAHEDFVRGLAKGLLFDQHQVDDIVQQAWLIAVRRPPQNRQSIRPWLAKVVRSVAVDKLRSSSRVKRREEAAAQPEALPSTAELIERESIRREVVDAVFALEEPYRSTVLIRYFEELTPQQIAHRLDVPLETVRTRLRRGLEKLRERLDKEHGGNRQAWCLSLVPLAAKAKTIAIASSVSGLSALFGGVLVMSLKMKLFLGLLMLGLGLFAWKVSASKENMGESVAKAPANVAPEEKPVALPEPKKLVPTEEPPSPRTPREISKPSEVSNPEKTKVVAVEKPRVAVVRGRILNERKEPIVGARIYATRSEMAGRMYTEDNEGNVKRDSLTTTVSKNDGSFEVSVGKKNREIALFVSADRYSDHWSKPFSVEDNDVLPVELVLQEGLPFQVRVLDRDSKQPVPGAWVSAYYISNQKSGRNSFAETDNKGESKFGLIPVTDLQLNVSKEQYAELQLHLTIAKIKAQPVMEVFLVKSEWQLRGKVLGPDGQPLPMTLNFNLIVVEQDPGLKEDFSLGIPSAMNYADGSFNIPITFTSDFVWLVLIANGKLVEKRQVFRNSGELTLTLDPTKIAKKEDTNIYFSITAVDSVTGKELKDAEARFEMLNSGLSNGHDSKKGFYVTHPGTYDFFVSAPGHGYVLVQQAELQAREPKPAFKVTLPREEKIRGRVDFSLLPNPSETTGMLLIQLRDSQGRDVPLFERAGLPSDGNFSIGQLNQELYQATVTLYTQGKIIAQGNVNIQAGDENVVIQLKPKS